MPDKKIVKEQRAKYLKLLGYDMDKEFSIESNVYEYLGYTLQSLLNICQSALYAKEENVHYHRNQDIANVLNLANHLIPMEELKLLDEILQRDEI